MTTEATWSEVRSYLDRCDHDLTAELRAAATAAAPAGRWSAVQIADHLNRTEMVMYPMWAVIPRLHRMPALIRVLDRSNAALWRMMGMAATVPVGRLTPANAALGEFRAPVFLAPGSRVQALDEVLERRRRIRGRTCRAILKVDEQTLRSLRWSHPLMGSYTLLEFAEFLGVHERHHLPQITRLRSGI